MTLQTLFWHHFWNGPSFINQTISLVLQKPQQAFPNLFFITLWQELFRFGALKMGVGIHKSVQIPWLESGYFHIKVQLKIIYLKKGEKVPLQKKTSTDFKKCKPFIFGGRDLCFGQVQTDFEAQEKLLIIRGLNRSRKNKHIKLITGFTVLAKKERFCLTEEKLTNCMRRRYYKCFSANSFWFQLYLAKHYTKPKALTRKGIEGGVLKPGR